MRISALVYKCSLDVIAYPDVKYFTGFWLHVCINYWHYGWVIKASSAFVSLVV